MPDMGCDPVYHHLIESGWTVREVRIAGKRSFEWRSPRGISGSDYYGDSGEVPVAVIDDARRHRDCHLPVGLGSN